MFLDFSKLEEQLPVIEEREQEMAASEKYYDVVLAATSLDDVNDVPTEDLARVVLGMADYIGGDERAKGQFTNIIAKAVSCKRVRTARLI